MRVGIRVGDVTFEDDDCFGLPVVEAQRLEAAAGPGQILCARRCSSSRAAAAATSSCASATSTSRASSPVTVLEVGWTPAGRSGAAASELPRLLSTQARLRSCGPAGEFASLVDAWKDTADGGSSVVLLSGEPGIGKTRLATELARRAPMTGAVVLAGRCDEELSVAYQPFAEALRFHLAAARPTIGRRRAARSAGGGELASSRSRARGSRARPAPTAGGDPEAERYRLFEAVTGWLPHAAASVAGAARARRPPLGRPADAAAAAPSHSRDRAAPLLHRRHLPRHRSRPHASARRDAGRPPPPRPGRRRIALDGLTADGVAELLERAAGHELDSGGHRARRGTLQRRRPATRSSSARCCATWRRAARSCERDGALDERPRRCSEVGIPEGIREVVGRRLTRSSTTPRRRCRLPP